ncbi:hypothetical protein ABZ464_26060 [Streptomyces sp. NPDC005820]|uniref:DUF7691 family protein n=1 Tax=Streptomyces sp. NPDC005820 TaxID=3157069 RepID=UPI00340481E2
MAEQYLSAYAVDADGFLGMVGSHDDALVRAALGGIPELGASGALLRARQAAEVEPALREIVTGRPDPSRPGGYGWLLELLGPTAGHRIGSIVPPGRDRRRLEDTFRAWDLTVLSALWGRCWTFPWHGPGPDHDPLPFPMLAPRAELARLRAELAAFDSERIDADHDLLPNGDDDIEEVAWLLDDILPSWTDAALAEDRDLLLVRDGGR